MQESRDQFEIEALPQNAAIARERVRRAASSSGIAGPSLDDVEIATGEAVTNAILYGSPQADSQITVSCWVAAESPPAFHVEVRDQGRGFDPSHLREGDDDALGGRGIRLMRALMDEVTLYYNGRGMVARLTKHLSPP
ncbi:MAG: ATP-binding protein [Caulobacteraceae bacterium]|nr:ATP-binding protein [Caulobacteraceae bacterium]